MDFDVLLDDLLCLSFEFESCVWTHVKRDGNSINHNLRRVIKKWCWESLAHGMP